MPPEGAFFGKKEAPSFLKGRSKSIQLDLLNHMRRIFTTAEDMANTFMLLLLGSAGMIKKPDRPWP